MAEIFQIVKKVAVKLYHKLSLDLMAFKLKAFFPVNLSWQFFDILILFNMVAF